MLKSVARHLPAAQTVVGRIVEFTRSADHDRRLPDTRPVVSEYQLELYTTGAATSFLSVSLGKPRPISGSDH